MALSPNVVVSRTTSTTGQQTAAKAAAPAAAAVVSGSHTFVAMRDFAIMINGHCLAYRAFTRYVVDTTTKAAISATDADVTWDN